VTKFTRLLALVALLMAAKPGFAEEFFQSYQAVIDIAEDGTLTVTETIVARVEGDRIVSNIDRRIPRFTLDGDGKLTKVGFKVFSAELDGAPTGWHANWAAENIDLSVGEFPRRHYNPVLTQGDHVFRLTYVTDRHIRFFDAYDELTWNVTGDGWELPVREIEATINLPQGAKPIKTDFFTGEPGAIGKDAYVLTADNKISASSTRPFLPGESLIIIVKLPKGVIAVPSTRSQWERWILDNLSLLIGCIGLVISLTYYYRAWSTVGRDQKSGRIAPRWVPPEGISPAVVNYIDRRGFGDNVWIAISATMLDLANKGYLRFETLLKIIIIQRTAKSLDVGTSPSDQTLLDAIEASGQHLPVDWKHGRRIKEMGEEFRSSIEMDHYEKYFKYNDDYRDTGSLLCVLLIGATLYFSGWGLEMTLLLGAFYFTFLGVVWCGNSSIRNIRSFGEVLIWLRTLISVVAVFIACLIFGELFMEDLWFEITHDLNSIGLIAATLILLINILFFFLLPAPTPLGRKMKDQIQGLRLYLRATKKDRLKIQGAPEMSSKHFEALLPYAVALGVEKNWIKSFESSCPAAATGADLYSPAWYQGDYSELRKLPSSLTSALSSIIASRQGR